MYAINIRFWTFYIVVLRTESLTHFLTVIIRVTRGPIAPLTVNFSLIWNQKSIEADTAWKVSKSRFFSGPQILDWIFSVCSPNAGKYGPEKTLYLNTFHAVWEKSFDAKSFEKSNVIDQKFRNWKRKKKSLILFDVSLLIFKINFQ